MTGKLNSKSFYHKSRIIVLQYVIILSVVLNKMKKQYKMTKILSIKTEDSFFDP